VTKTSIYAVAADGLYTGDTMGAQVVCISRTDGALGEEIGPSRPRTRLIQHRVRAIVRREGERYE